MALQFQLTIDAPNRFFVNGVGLSLSPISLLTFPDFFLSAATFVPEALICLTVSCSDGNSTVNCSSDRWAVSQSHSWTAWLTWGLWLLRLHSPGWQDCLVSLLAFPVSHWQQKEQHFAAGWPPEGISTPFSPLTLSAAVASASPEKRQNGDDVILEHAPPM